MPVLLLLIVGCEALTGLFGDPAAAVAEADIALRGGNLTAARDLYTSAAAAHPEDVDAVSGLAYLDLLAGDAAGADRRLATLPAGPRTGEIELRRALVALAAGDLDAVRSHGLASGRAAGRLLAGEVDLADGNRDAARGNLTAARDAPGEVGILAGQYLSLLGDADPQMAGLAEVQALWALGRRATAARSVEELVRAYAQSHDDGSEQILLWAGRAAVAGEPVIADRLLESLTVPPAGQSWRVGATRAIARCAAGEGEPCRSAFAAIYNVAPPDGYTDAVVTAAALLARSDPAGARSLVDGLQGDAAARLLGQLGDSAAARRIVTDPILRGSL